MKILVALFAFIAISATTFAQVGYTGGNATATASFDCRVIKALSWAKTSDVVLQEVVKGTSRTLVGADQKTITFTLTGEADATTPYTVALTVTSPIAVDNVVLNGTWSQGSATGLELNGTTGQLATTYTATSIDATNPLATPGSKIFTISVSAEYMPL